VVDGDLARQARAVLDANWLGHATSPSRRLYPHQWSWDSACIAMGYSSWNQARAQTELRSLFAGQWSNGLLPHIVFTAGARYFPGPEFWETERSAHAPAAPRTSGIVQPPIHATAALRVYENARDRDRAREFLGELLPKLTTWHSYLYRERVRDDDGLVEVWHPWESGMDNSPLWDDALARLAPGLDEIPPYERIDVEVAEAAERPTDADYDRYAYLVRFLRDRSYDAAQVRATAPFVVQAVLFNSLLVQANRDLAEIARLTGGDPDRFEEWGDRTAQAIDDKLWDEEGALYADFDVRAGDRVPARSSAGYAPLYAGVPAPERARQMIASLPAAGIDVDGGWAATSLPPTDPRFEPNLYWRGPVWPILNWVLYRGLLRYGYRELAIQVRDAMLGLSRRGGFWEHYSPTTGEGHGGDEFAWTAALVLDLLREEGDDMDAKRRDEIGKEELA
jgi:glycogen debranching enzyme